ncbi:MAG: hypothetical protein JSS59_09245 [Proteobacteria bacterium]|uniref:hypothetical protein n=1 Tax=Rudaea sp. TaxID=2136325 RepID=UPI00378385D3|nr:hypothetical protein [Pseudomonadota bacterium]
MKMQFLLSLLPRDRRFGVRDAYCATSRALPHVAANEASFARKKPICRWRRDPAGGKLLARWTTRE